MPISLNTQSVNSNAQALQKASECSGCRVRDTSFCQAVPDHGLNALSQSRNRIRFGKRQTITTEGDPATAFFNVTSGVVKLTHSAPDGRVQIVGFRVPGEFFAAPTSEKYTTSAVAITDVELCRFPRAHFKRLLSEWPDMVARLFEMNSAQLTASEEQVFLLGRKTARERVASFLLAYGNRTMPDQREPLRLVSLPMTRAEIADFLGLTIETVSRVLSSLVREGLITVGISRSVYFHNLPALMRVAGE